MSRTLETMYDARVSKREREGRRDQFIVQTIRAHGDEALT